MTISAFLVAPSAFNISATFLVLISLMVRSSTTTTLFSSALDVKADFMALRLIFLFMAIR